MAAQHLNKCTEDTGRAAEDKIIDQSGLGRNLPYNQNPGKEDQTLPANPILTFFPLPEKPCLIG